MHNPSVRNSLFIFAKKFCRLAKIWYWVFVTFCRVCHWVFVKNDALWKRIKRVSEPFISLAFCKSYAHIYLLSNKLIFVWNSVMLFQYWHINKQGYFNSLTFSDDCLQFSLRDIDRFRSSEFLAFILWNKATAYRAAWVHLSAGSI